ncbi:MAG: ABC transporter permease [Firmicutes bacterium]|nr:ABC transporter permease [Bacillota bacterium]
MKNIYLLILLVTLSGISLFIGVTDLNLSQILAGDTGSIQIMLISRIPRLITIIIAGMSMSISGLIMQQLSRNKFVAPSTAATVDSAKFGVLVSLILFPAASSFGKMLVAFAFALMGTFLFMGILRRIKLRDAVFIPLIGIMLGNIIDSITTFVAYRYDLIQNISSWLMGNFAMVIKGRYELLYLSVPLVIIAYFYANKFTIAGMGEDFSKNLGLNYNQVVNIGLVIVALISAIVIITVGRIPFLGLVVPNIVTIYQGDHLKKSISTTALLGSVFLLACDILGRVIIYPYEISIGLTVGVIGSVIFLYLIFRRNEA